MKFVPPGDRLNPYHRGTAVTLAGGWRFRVNSAIIDADAQVAAVTDQYGNHINPPPRAGAQYTVVNVTVTYVGAGSSYLANFLLDYGQIQVEGAGKAAYELTECTPPPQDLTAVGEVSSGQTETGNLCYEIASTDAATLLLTGLPSGGLYQNVWFALR